MTRFAWLLRRELWEHRAIWMAPAIVVVLLLVAAVSGNVFMGSVKIDAGTDADRPALSAEDIDRIRESGGLTDEQLDQLRSLRAGEKVDLAEAIGLAPEDKRSAIAFVAYMVLALLMFLVVGIIGFFYALDSLYADRRDRSVLFWKSLPLSDLETVLSKFTVAVVLVPLVAVAASIVAQVVVASGASIKVAMMGGPVSFMWAPQTLGGGALAAMLLGVVATLWYAPVVAYLLLASAWAPKSPFLWAVLPPVALMIAEEIAFGSSHVYSFVNHRLLHPLKSLAGDDSAAPAVVIEGDDMADMPPRLAEFASGVADFFTSPEMLLGLVAAAALLAGAIWVRRYRDETM